MNGLNVNTADGFENYRASEDNYQSGTADSTNLVPDQKLETDQCNENLKAKERRNIDSESFSDFFQPSAEDVETRNQNGTRIEPDWNHPGRKTQGGLSLKEAVKHYKISEKTVRLYIKDGKIPARKEDGPRCPEWRIYPEGLPTEISKIATVENFHDGSEVQEVESVLVEAGTKVEPERKQHGTDMEPDWYIDSKIPAPSQESLVSFTPELKTLLDVITKQAEKLEAASMRIGYLEARTENYESQIKLLTDSQHKRGWWVRFSSWFLGK